MVTVKNDKAWQESVGEGTDDNGEEDLKHATNGSQKAVDTRPWSMPRPWRVFESSQPVPETESAAGVSVSPAVNKVSGEPSDLPHRPAYRGLVRVRRKRGQHLRLWQGGMWVTVCKEGWA